MWICLVSNSVSCSLSNLSDRTAPKNKKMSGELLAFVREMKLFQKEAQFEGLNNRLLLNILTTLAVFTLLKGFRSCFYQDAFEEKSAWGNRTSISQSSTFRYTK